MQPELFPTAEPFNIFKMEKDQNSKIKINEDFQSFQSNLRKALSNQEMTNAEKVK